MSFQHIYESNGLCASFPFSFPIAAETDLQVRIDGVEWETGFVLRGLGSAEGGAVIFQAPPASGQTIVIRHRGHVAVSAPDAALGHLTDKLVAGPGTVLTTQVDETGYQTLVISAVSGSSVALLSHELVQGSGGGTTAAGTWQTRPLNQEVYDPTGLVNLSNNQMLLEAGTYLMSASGTFFSHIDTQMSFRHRLRNVTDNTTLAFSQLGRLHLTTGTSGNSEAPIAPTLVTLDGPKVVELQYYAQSVLANGLGCTGMLTGEPERFAWVHIQKIA